MSAWNKFPHENTRFTYTGDKLLQAWDQLHAGDCEPFPEIIAAASLAVVFTGGIFIRQ